MREEWELRGYNASDRVLGEGGDCPVQPGGLISGILCDTEEEARGWLDCWLRGSHWTRPTRITLSHNGKVVETHDG